MIGKILILSAAIISLDRNFETCFTSLELDDQNFQYFSYESIVQHFGESELLGKGQIGEIRSMFLGGKYFAVKIVPIPSEDYLLEELEQELLLQKLFGKINISAKLFGCFEYESKFFIIQERLYKDLQSFEIRQKMLNLESFDRLRIYKKLAENFQIVHDFRFSHQDIKLSNIMTLDENLTEFRIIDFELSKMFDEPISGGTFEFEAPEKFSENTLASAYHDIYAFAMTVAYSEQLEGCELSKITADCYDVMPTDYCVTEQFENLEKFFNCSDIPQLLNIVKKAISPKEKSYSSMKEMAHDIDKLANEIFDEFSKEDSQSFRGQNFKHKNEKQELDFHLDDVRHLSLDSVAYEMNTTVNVSNPHQSFQENFEANPEISEYYQIFDKSLVDDYEYKLLPKIHIVMIFFDSFFIHNEQNRKSELVSINANRNALDNT